MVSETCYDKETHEFVLRIPEGEIAEGLEYCLRRKPTRKEVKKTGLGIVQYIAYDAIWYEIKKYWVSHFPNG
jgi:hypothetical protein